jgi:hypothetical protein
VVARARSLVIVVFSLLPPATPAAADANLPSLLNLRGARSTVRYSPGSLDRAAHVQARLDALAEDFATWGGGQRELLAFVLGPEDWQAAGLLRAYGLPELTGPAGNAGIALPAWGDDRTIAVWRALLGTAGGPLPWSAGTPVRGTPEEAASLAAADLLAQIDLAREFVDRARLAGGPPWIRELLAATVARAAFERHEAERRQEIVDFFGALARGAASAGAAGGALIGYRDDLPYPERVAASGRFFAAAGFLLDRDRAKTVPRLMKLAGKNGRPLAPGDLLPRYPGLKEWLEAAGVASP